MMSQPSPDCSADAPPGLDPGRLDGTNINPVTGLATDFLNHFNEAIMLLEMLPMAPDCKADFLDWRPMTYCEHFAASHFKHRDLAIFAYQTADPVFRARLDEITDQMNVILLATAEGMRIELSPHATGVLAASAARWLKPLVGHAGAVINGQMIGPAQDDEAIAQDAVDAVFDDAVADVFEG
jgi:hypothetical protein